MSHVLTTPRPTAWPDARREASPLARIGAIAGFAALTALGAKIALPLPFTPVPITLQTFFVLVSGVVLGGRDGGASQLAYLTAGVAGLPVFAGPTAGAAYLLGPTGGFLLAFPIAAWIAGAGIRRPSGVARAVVVLCLAEVVVFAMGGGWLAWSLGTGLGTALALGVWPFLPGAVLKLAGAAAVAVRRPAV